MEQFLIKLYLFDSLAAGPMRAGAHWRNAQKGSHKDRHRGEGQVPSELAHSAASTPLDLSISLAQDRAKTCAAQSPKVSGYAFCRHCSKAPSYKKWRLKKLSKKKDKVQKLIEFLIIAFFLKK